STSNQLMALPRSTVVRKMDRDQTFDWLDNQWPATQFEVRDESIPSSKESLPFSVARKAIQEGKVHACIWADGTESLIWKGQARIALLRPKESRKDRPLDIDGSL